MQAKLLLEGIVTFSGYPIIIFGIFVCSVWIGVISVYIQLSKKKIRDLRLPNDPMEEKKLRTEIIKYKLMLVVIVIEMLMSFSLLLQLLGISFHIATHPCLTQIETLKYFLLITGTAPYTLIICLIGALTALVLYVKNTLNRSNGVNVIKKVAAWIIVQLIVLIPLNLISQINLFSSYAYFVCNTVNLILFYRGVRGLGRVLKWRAQDARYDCNVDSLRVRSFSRIERNYHIMSTCLLIAVGLFIISINLDLLIDAGILEPILSECNYYLVITELSHLVKQYELREYLDSLRIFFQGLRLVTGFSWGLVFIILYTTVLVRMWIQKVKKPKCVRFKVVYSPSLQRPLLKPI